VHVGRVGVEGDQIVQENINISPHRDQIREYLAIELQRLTE
jgi:hypothetical protein